MYARLFVDSHVQVADNLARGTSDTVAKAVPVTAGNLIHSEQRRCFLRFALLTPKHGKRSFAVDTKRKACRVQIHFLAVLSIPYEYTAQISRSVATSHLARVKFNRVKLLRSSFPKVCAAGKPLAPNDPLRCER